MDKNTQNKLTKLTKKDKKERLVKLLEANLGHISKSCKELNIARQTYYDWCSEDEDFKIECDNVSESLLDIAEHKLMTKIEEGDNTCIIFFLKTKGRSRGYDEKQQIELIKPISDINFDEI